MGLYHVLDFAAYDHILFLIVLAVIFSFHQFKKVVIASLDPNPKVESVEKLRLAGIEVELADSNSKDKKKNKE